MAWELHIEGYRTADGERETDAHIAETTAAIANGDVDGVFVHAHDPEDSENDDWFWVYHIGFFANLDEALDLAADVAGDNYGIEL